MSEMAAGRYSQIDRFLATVAQKPDHPFIIFQEAPGNGQNVVISYREADEQSTRLARYLVDECGAKPGDMIASLNENHPGFIIVMLACWKLGGAVGYLNFSQTGRVFQHSVSVSQAKIVVFEPRLYSRIEENKDWFAERGNQLVCYSDFPESGPELPFPHKFVTVPDLKAKYPDIKKAEIPKEMRKDVLPSSVASLVYTSGRSDRSNMERPL
jgi:acyl-CoA synthetase (AMP-forming)/AMP-acid ligase II